MVEKKFYIRWNIKYKMIKIVIRNSMEEGWDKSGDIYNEGVYKEDIVARIKALGISLKKNISFYQ